MITGLVEFFTPSLKFDATAQHRPFYAGIGDEIENAEICINVSSIEELGRMIADERSSMIMQALARRLAPEHRLTFKIRPELRR